MSKVYNKMNETILSIYDLHKNFSFFSIDVSKHQTESYK